MKKQKFKSILLLALFSLAFILGGCSSNTPKEDSSTGTVVEAPASSYCKNGTHMYAPDPSICLLYTSRSKDASSSEKREDNFSAQV